MRTSSSGEGCAWFITPYETRMSLPAFFRFLRDSRKTHGAARLVPYLQVRRERWGGRGTTAGKLTEKAGPSPPLLRLDLARQRVYPGVPLP